PDLFIAASGHVPRTIATSRASLRARRADVARACSELRLWNACLSGGVRPCCGANPKRRAMPSEPLIGGAAAAATAVKDVTTKTFMTEVVDCSFDALVIADLWAPWCAPCKQLRPILE